MPTVSRSFPKRYSSSSTLNSSFPSLGSKGRLNRATTTPAYAVFNDNGDEPRRLRSRSVDSEKTPPPVEEPDLLADRLAFPSPARDDEEQKLVYASLPSTPIASAPPGMFPRAHSLEPELAMSDPQAEIIHTYTPFTLWDYLREELFATDFDSHQELKWERVSNFLGMPLAMEKVRQSLVSTFQTLTTADHRIWFYVMLRLFPLYIYYSTHQIRHCFCSADLEYTLTIFLASTTFPES
jgi:hypothetical protein